MPVNEVTVSVDEGTGKAVFIDRELRYASIGVWGPETKTDGRPPFLAVGTRLHEQAS